jgi:hypothetical protein
MGLSRKTGNGSTCSQRNINRDEFLVDPLKPRDRFLRRANLSQECRFLGSGPDFGSW